MTSNDPRNSLPSYPRVYLTIARRNANVSGEALAFELGITKGYYYALENGARGHKITVIMLARITELLGADPTQMIKDEVRYQEERDVYIRSKTKKKT